MLWVLRFRPKMATLKNMQMSCISPTASHVHRREQTISHLNLRNFLSTNDYSYFCIHHIVHVDVVTTVYCLSLYPYLLLSQEGCTVRQ